MASLRPQRPCPQPGCRTLGPGGYCATHKRTTPTYPRYGDYSRQSWRKTRTAMLEYNPYCVVCGAPANTVDHIIPIRRGGTDDEDNLQSMCSVCHSRKTAAEVRG